MRAAGIEVAGNQDGAGESHTSEPLGVLAFKMVHTLVRKAKTPLGFA